MTNVVGRAAMAVNVAKANRKADRAVEDLDTRHYACEYHRGPFRWEWPKGWPTFVETVVNHLLERAPNFARVAEGDVIKVERILSDTPACEWLERNQLMEAYHESGIGYKARCSICGDKRSGTRYLLKVGELRVPYKHVCWSCLIDKKGGLASKGGIEVPE